MFASCVTVRDPFHPSASRELRALNGPGPIRALALKEPVPFIILRNGAPVMRADWDEPVNSGDVIVVVVLPEGGGGGSNPLKMILTIAVSFFAPYAGTWIAGQMGATLATGSFAAMAVNAVSTMVGMALVNALIPPPKPTSAQQAQALAAPSPTYNLQSQGNMGRLDQAIPVQYGRMMSYPDFAAMPYAEYSGNEQFLYQLFCLGQGEYNIEAIRIEDTPIASFAEITYEVIPPHGNLTLFPSNVVTSPEVSGQELTNSYLGGYIANAAGSEANTLGIDLVTPRGLYYANDAGGLDRVSLTVVVEARTIDSGGAPTGAWTTLGTETISDKTTTPQRISRRYTVAAGRYEVRMRRTDTKQTDSRYGHEVIWAGLRAYLPETRTFGDVTLIAMRMRASNNLSSQASRKVNVISTRKLPIWNGTTWSAATATTSIAWAIADACRNETYGGRLTDSRIDLAGLLALNATWASRGDQFNGRFDSAISFWEAVSKIAVAGRAKPYMQGGIMRLTRDGPASIPVTLFSMRNIKRGSLSINYILPGDDTADAVEVAYFDEQYWKPQRVTCTLAGSTANRPAKVDLFGVTGRQQAYKEGLYQAASNRYRRRIIKFSSEMEGFIPAPGDLIAIQHDMPAWGQHAEAVAWDAGTRALTLSEPVTFGAGTHYVGLRKKDGSIDGPYAVTAGADAYTVVLGATPTPPPYTGSAYERTHVVFGAGEAWRQPAKVIAIRPRGLYDVEIEAVNEDPSVHTAEDGMTAPAVSYSSLQTLYTAPVIAGLNMASSTTDNSKALLTWTPAPGADGYQIEMAQGTDPYASDISWTRVGETSANNFAVTALYGAQTLIRVRAIGMSAGPWVTMFYGSSADYMWTNDAALMWNAVTTTPMWRY